METSLEKLRQAHVFLDKHFWSPILSSIKDGYHYEVVECTCGDMRYRRGEEHKMLPSNLRRFEYDRRVDFLSNVYVALTKEQRLRFLMVLDKEALPASKIRRIRECVPSDTWPLFTNITKEE